MRFTALERELSKGVKAEAQNMGKRFWFPGRGRGIRRDKGRSFKKREGWKPAGYWKNK